MINQNVPNIKVNPFYSQTVQHIVDSQQTGEQIDELNRHVV